ncbi:MAG: hypothetical protein MR446_09830 [Bacteroidales bacterium]|nr:hypothetical protein [Bacteroidales bacterium]
MKKNTLWRLLSCTLLLVGCLSFGACSDDDNDGGNGNADIDTEEQAIVAENEFARIASVLAKPTELGSDWASQTLEPAVGRPVEGNTSVHMVAVADEKEALDFYNGLTGQHLAEGTTGNTWTYPGIGSLSYEKRNEADCFAVVDVDIRQIPTLKQVKLVPSSVLGDNAADEAYYSFGDVIYDTRDGSYWVCGRPASPKFGKDKSWWFSFDIPDANVKKDVKASARVDGKKKKVVVGNLPYKLNGTSDKVTTFGEMLTLIANPYLYNTYATLVGRPQGLGSITDKSAQEMVNFFRLVKREWKDNKLVAKIFPGMNNVSQYEEPLTDDDMFQILQWPFTIYYAGYKVNSDGNIVLPACSFNGSSGKGADGKSGLVLFSTTLRDFIVRPGQETFDITPCIAHYSNLPNKIADNSYLNGYGFVIRVKDGQELSTNWFFTPDPTKALPGVDKKVLVEEFRYNAPPVIDF